MQKLRGYHPGRWWGRTPRRATPLMELSNGTKVTRTYSRESNTAIPPGPGLEQLLDPSLLEAPRRAARGQRQEAHVEAVEDSGQEIL